MPQSGVFLVGFPEVQRNPQIIFDSFPGRPKLLAVLMSRLKWITFTLHRVSERAQRVQCHGWSWVPAVIAYVNKQSQGRKPRGPRVTSEIINRS